MSNIPDIGPDVKKYILSFNYCVENLDAIGVFTTWFENFWNETYKNKLIFNNEKQVDHADRRLHDRRDRRDLHQIKRKKLGLIGKDVLSIIKKKFGSKIYAIIKRVDEFIREQSTIIYPTKDDLDDLYKILVYKEFKEYKTYEKKLLKSVNGESTLEFEDIQTSILNLYSKCRELYKHDRHKYRSVDYVNLDPDASSKEKIWVDGKFTYFYINGVTYKTGLVPRPGKKEYKRLPSGKLKEIYIWDPIFDFPQAVTDYNNVFGKMVGGSLYPLTDEDIENLKHRSGRTSYFKNFVYKGKQIPAILNQDIEDQLAADVLNDQDNAEAF